MNKPIDKKLFYKTLRSLGRDIHHGIMCNLVCFDPYGECDCYSFNIPDEDIKFINERLNKFKTYKEALKYLISKDDDRYKKSSF